MTRVDVQGSGVAEAALPAGMAEHSRLVQRLRRRYADTLPLLPAGAPDRTRLEQALGALRERGHDTGAALRMLRQLVMERLVVLDCEQGAPLEVITRAVTELAELALDAACTEAFAQLDERHGAPLTERGARAHLWVIGMGKLGARELNVSSDIDLVQVYDEDGQCAGRADGAGVISVHDYFTRATRLICALIGDVTEHGFVFRVDLALRPNGNSGPSVCSLAALEEYMLVQGREWERFAWLKSRVVAPRAALVDGSALALRGVVMPFVFRRYLDYSVFESLRTLHRQIRDHAAKRSAGRPERANDVKMSRGGIREIEFIVQLLQVVRGGQFPELRTRPTLQALQCVARAGLMPGDTAEALARAYTFLRRVEHRIQYLDDQQTHILPTDDDDLAWIARTLGFADTSAFLGELDSHRELVAEEFDRLLGGSTPCKTCGKPGGESTAGTPAVGSDLDDVPALFDSDLVRQHLGNWCSEPRVRELRDSAQRRLVQLLTRTASWLGEGRVDDTAVLRFLDWLDTLLRRENYLALLVERPAVHERLLRVLGMARWPARYLLQHPGVIDELAGPSLLAHRFDAALLERELDERRQALARGGEDDEENLMGLLRRAHQAEVFRTLVRDVEGRISVEQVADDLSALADAILRVTVRWCWPLVRHRHRDTPQLGLIAYGKLGGKELGYGGDLDLVFVYDDEHERAPEIYASFVRKLITWLTLQTGEGHLYDIDTALRPNGSSGLLVTSFDAYADYQQQRGSNTAWTWEHQAMTRARMVPPRSAAAPAALPPEGAPAALGRPGDGGMVPPRSAATPAALPPEGAPAALGRPGDGGMVPPRSAAAPAALPPEGAPAALGRPGDGGMVVPPRSAAAPAALPPEGASAALGRPGDGGMVPPRSAAAPAALLPEGAATRTWGSPAAGGVTPPRSGAAPGSESEDAFDLTARFDAVRHAVMTAPRDAAALRAEIVAMRERIRAAHPVPAGLFDIKHSVGGMVDAEFATQCLVLLHTAPHPELEPNLGNIALLIRAEQVGLLPAGVGQAAADAYRNLRRVQHRARLDEQPTQVAPHALAAECDAIERLWQAVFA